MPGRAHGPSWLCLLALLVAGCGGGDDGGGDRPTAPAPTGQPSAKEPLAAAAGRLADAVPRRDCKELIGVMLHSIQRGTEPDAPATAGECRFIKTEARNELRGLRVTKVIDFGTAGFSEGSGANAGQGEVVGVVWALDADRSWKAVYEAVFREQIGVHAQLAGQADTNAVRLLAALRAANCKDLWRLLNLASRFVRQVEGRRERFCRGLPAVYKDRRSAFAQIKADASVTPKLLGRTRDFSFYALRLKNGRYMDLVMSGPLANIADDEVKDHDSPAALELLTVRQPR